MEKSIKSSNVRKTSLVEKIIRGGVSVALVAGMSVPAGVTQVFADTGSSSGAIAQKAYAGVEENWTMTDFDPLNDPTYSSCVLGTTTVSVKKGNDGFYLYFSPTSGTVGTIERTSDEYNALKTKYQDQILAVKTADGTKISIINENVVTDCDFFSGLTQLRDVGDLCDATKFDVSGISGLSNFFKNCSSLTSIDVSSWNVSKCSSFSGMFSGCSSLTSVKGLDKWKIGTSSISSNILMGQFFNGCSSLKTLDDIQNFDLSKVDDLDSFFYGCSNLTDISAMKTWKFNDSEGFRSKEFFAYCTNLKNVDIVNDIFTAEQLVKNLSSYGMMFIGCSGIETLDLSAYTQSIYGGLIDYGGTGYLSPSFFFNINQSSIKEFKMFTRKDAAELFNNTDGNICSVNLIKNGSNKAYKLRGEDKYYWTWDELMNDFDNVSGKWVDIIDTATVNFYSDNTYSSLNSTSRSIIGKSGIILPDTPTQVGASFDGWCYKDANGVEKTFSTSQIINGDMNVYAKWIENKATSDDKGSGSVINTVTNKIYVVNATYTEGGVTKALNGANISFEEDKIKVSTDKALENVQIHVESENKAVSGMTIDYDGAQVKTDKSGNAVFYSDKGTTDKNGKATVKDPATGALRNITVTDTAGKPITGAEVQIKNGQIVVTNPTKGNIVVTVKDGSSKPVTGTGVTAFSADGTLSSGKTDVNGQYKTSNSSSVSGGVTTDANGKALVTDANGNVRNITVTDTSGKPVAGADVSSKNGNIVVSSPNDKDLKVTVKDGKNKPVKDAGVTVIKSSGDTLSGKTDTNGVYQAIQTITMLRLYNPYTGEHFYTSDVKEKTNLVNVGWRDEGTGWTSPKTSSTPVYRLYNSHVAGGDHHYTTNKAERDNLVKKGWTYEGVGWYSDDSKSVAVYRQYNPYAVSGTHNYTVSKSENDHLVSVGWKAEGIGWYGVK